MKPREVLYQKVREGAVRDDDEPIPIIQLPRLVADPNASDPGSLLDLFQRGVVSRSGTLVIPRLATAPQLGRVEGKAELLDERAERAERRPRVAGPSAVLLQLGEQGDAREVLSDGGGESRAGRLYGAAERRGDYELHAVHVRVRIPQFVTLFIA